MSNTSILVIPEVANGQNQPEITINDAINFLEQSVNNVYTLGGVGAGPVTIVEADFIRNQTFVFSGPSGDYIINTPPQIAGVPTKRVFIVHNNDALYSATIDGGGGTTVIARPNEIVFCYQNSFNVYLCTGNFVLPKPHDIAVFISGKPLASQEVLLFNVTRSFTLEDDFAGSIGSVLINPTASAVFTPKKNGTSLGSITINTSGVFTFVTSGGIQETFAVNDTFEVVAPGVQDTTLSDVAMTFKGTLV